jgi:hypothetical protein
MEAETDTYRWLAELVTECLGVDQQDFASSCRD